MHILRFIALYGIYYVFNFILFSLENDDMESSKHCVKLLLLIFIIRCLTKSNLIRIYGRSTANQRTEAWQGCLRQGFADWWIENFKNLRDSDLYNDENVIHRECLRFCFMDLIQDELNRVVLERNPHRIRPSTNLESPSGRPDIL